MKLATFTAAGVTRIGVVRDGGIADLSVAAPELPRDMKDFLRAGDAALKRAGAAAASAPLLPLVDVVLEAPVPHPGKVLAIGLNYRDHVEESGQPLPEHQVWFNKQHNCIVGPHAEVALPSVSAFLDYEAEMCFVIGKRCKHVPAERAHEVIAGYFVGNDVSVRDWQLRTNTWQIGKSFDTHGPIGPWIVTPDEVGDPHALDIKCWVNGELRQNSNTKHLIFNCFDQVAHLTQAFTLDVGDVIFTGTSSGVGGAMKPPQFLKVGDVVRVEVEKLGAIENVVVPEIAETVIEAA
ncbi:MAG: fumarylacetoacetate hydrolase family protein [Parvibaculum sp.]|uniref:fumarylacetoacetate hydrolase family protein n=1 Tax=Parvibaculum sp. TaxID=2024848 RepID=UPI00271899F4|nr:fumarylacetoacetate hydrolase family protein [Parvibaculum sp.]MDO8837825.1 fumarylacetoacetate hydrolase family protein [Parvibaculum sp.]